MTLGIRATISIRTVIDQYARGDIFSEVYGRGILYLWLGLGFW